MFPLSVMQRRRPLLTRQTQVLHSRGCLGRRRSYSLLRSSATPPTRTPSTNIRFIRSLASARQCIQKGRATLLRSAAQRPVRKILAAWIAFTILVSCVYEPLRDRGFLADLADSTIFRVIPPKLVKVPVGVDETKYRPLTGEKEIRLLILESGVPGEKVRCRLVHAERSWRTRYEALSYVWGDGKETRLMNCSGLDEVVYINLHDALSDLRLPDRERVLWTDRLCINQADDEEIGAQMQLMGEIYSGASSVVVYLGKADTSFESAIKCIRRDDSVWRGFSSKNPLRIAYAGWHIGAGEEMDWCPLINLLLRPWFRRTWVFQEAVLAKRGQVICGDQSVPWPVFERAVEALIVSRTAGKDIPACEPVDSIIPGISLMASVRLVRDTEWKKRFLPHLWLYGTPRIIDSRKSPLYRQSSLKLLDLILDSRSLLVTEAEDKIFGMLGVTNQDVKSDYLKKDPSLTPGDVFRNFVLWDIFDNNSLRALGSSSEKAGSQYSSPSWVPDFQRLDLQSSLTGTRNRLMFDASAGLPKEVWTSNEETVLHVKGRVVDILHTIGKKSPAAPNTFAGENAHVYNFEGLEHLHINKHIIEEAKNIWLAATKKLGNSRDPFVMASIKKGTLSTTREDGKISWSPFLRTLVCDRTNEGKKANRDFIRDNVGPFVRQSLEVDIIPEYLLQKDRDQGIAGLQAFTRLTESRRFAATDIGLTGWVPMRAKKGDLVCILYGSDVPFVVREAAGGRYSLVGECYVHGIMGGEVLKIDDRKDQEKVFTFT